MKAMTLRLTRDSYPNLKLAIQEVIIKNVEELKQPIEVVIQNLTTAKEKRFIVQNSLMWHWLGEEANFNNKRASHLGKEYTPAQLHLVNKLDYGIPILSRDTAFMAMWAQFRYHSRPAKVAMLKYIPVTSIMDVDQMAEYLTTLKQDKEDNGIILTDRHDMEQEALGRGKRV